VTDRFTVADALGWTLLLMLTWWLFAALTFALAPNAGHDLVTGAGVQVIVSLVVCALFASRRPGQSWSELFAMRGASVPSLLVALLLGAALCPPAERLALVIHSVYPLPKELLEQQAEMFRIRSTLHGVVLFLVAAGAGPLAEELFFRGALFTAQRRHATTLATVSTTSLLFTLFHPDPRAWAPILPLAFVIGMVRARTGSMFTALLVHAGFNATALAMTHTLPSAVAPPLALVLGGVLMAVLLSGLLWMLGNGSTAKQARELDGGLSS
jgi:membrane protease YdiL (CAAX protease family)